MAAAVRIAGIDALRGWAALCVCVQHAAHPIIAHPAMPGEWRAWLSAVTVDHFDLGRYGVILFFLVSGYVIPFSLHGAHALPRFAVTRAARLYPAFWLSVAAILVTGTTLPPAAQVAANLTMTPAMFGQPALSGVYWTLFVELVFYALCAALFAAGLLRYAAMLFAIGLGCVALPLAGVLLHGVGVPVPIVYLGAHLSFLFAGTLMRFAAEQRTAAACRRAAALTMIALAAMPLLAVQPDGRFTLSTPLGVTLAGVAAAATFAMLHHRAGTGLPWLLRLGAFSYSLYLFHIPVTRVAMRLVPPTGTAAAILYLALALAGTLAVAAVVYAWVERPCIDWAKRRWQRRAAGSTAAITVAP